MEEGKDRVGGKGIPLALLQGCFFRERGFMWGNQTAPRGQIPLNLKAQHLKKPGTFAALVQFSQRWGAAGVAPAMLAGLMPRDEEAQMPSRDSAWPEGQKLPTSI